MDAKVGNYLLYIFRSFQGFRTVDVKEFHEDRRMELQRESERREKRCNIKIASNVSAMVPWDRLGIPWIWIKKAINLELTHNPVPSAERRPLDTQL